MATNNDKTLEALRDLYDTLEWLGKSGNLASPIRPHPFGLGVIAAKVNAREVFADAGIKLNEHGYTR